MAIHPPKKRALPKPRQPGVSKYHGVRMTEEEYLSLPEEKPYLEYVDGMVLQKPMPNANHADLVGELQYHLVAYRKARGGRTGPERRVRLRDAASYRLPDTAFWVPGIPSGNDTVPTLAIEVRSPDQTKTELRAKCRAYRSGGVQVCWLFDPADRTVEVFEGRRDGEAIPPHGQLESTVLPGFSVDLDDLFSVLDTE